MGLATDIGAILLAILSVAVVLYTFTDIIGKQQLIMAGGGVGLLILIAIVYSLSGTTKRSSKNIIPSSSSSRSNADIRSQRDAVDRVNDLLGDDPEWDKIRANPDYTYAERRKIINKKTRDAEPHWAILSKMKHRKLPVLIIYSAHEDMIVKYEPVPPAHRRDEMFDDFDPVVLERLMSRSYDEEEEEDDRGQFEFNINDNRPNEEEEGGGFF